MWSSCIYMFLNYIFWLPEHHHHTHQSMDWLLFQWTIGAIVSVHWRSSLCRPLWRSCCLFVSLFRMYINHVIGCWQCTSQFWLQLLLRICSLLLSLQIQISTGNSWHLLLIWIKIFLLVLRCHGHDDCSLLQTCQSSCLQMFNMRIFY